MLSSRQFSRDDIILLDRRRLDEWLRLDKCRMETRRTLDKQIYLLATGVFVLTINMFIFVKDDIKDTRFLVCVWVLLLISVVTHTINYIFSEKRTIKQMRLTDLKWKLLIGSYDEGETEETVKWEKEVIEEDERKMFDVIDFLNWFSLASLLISILYLTVFMIVFIQQ